PGSDPPLAGPDQIDEEAAFVVFYLRSRRHTDDQVLAALAVAVGALPVLAPFGFEMDAAREVDQGRKPLVDLKDHVAAPATVAAVGTSRGDVLFPAKAHTAVAPVPGFDVNARLVDKHAVITSGRRCPTQEQKDPELCPGPV